MRPNQRTGAARGPTTHTAKPSFAAFLIVFVMGCFLFLGAVITGTEPRLRLARDPQRTVAATASNTLAGVQFFSKTIGPVETAEVRTDRRRDRRPGETRAEWERQKPQPSLVIRSKDGQELRWDRESDLQVVSGFLKGNEPELSLANRPPAWRLAITWAFAGLGGLTWLGALRQLLPGRMPATLP